jgi:hypothetical protein
MRTVIVLAHPISEVQFDIVLDAVAIELTFNQPLVAANDNRQAGIFIPLPEDWSDCVAAPPDVQWPDLDFGVSPCG